MTNYILTGTPGAGKTALLRLLERRGFAVVEEAATDVIAVAEACGQDEHWTQPTFIDDILDLQRRRQLRAASWPDPVVIFDRSPVCTWALARFLGREPTPALTQEMQRIAAGGVYDRRVLFVENLGYCNPTHARRITFEDSLTFEAVHAETYESFGFDLVRIAAAPIEERLAKVIAALGALA